MGIHWERLKILGLGSLLLAMLSACSLPDFSLSNSGEMIAIIADQATLQLDEPSGTIDHYTVCYRTHGSLNWIALADVPANPQPEYTVEHSVLGNGEFDFAVVAVDAAEQRSTYHSSLDITAEPQTGRYVLWFVR